MNRIVLFFLFLPFSVFSQVDTEFWFAPPEVTSSHGDRPALLRLSTSETGATVNIYRPAINNQPIATIVVAANSTRNIRLDNIISDWETAPANTVLKTGLLIRATAPITAYYELGADWNTDIFVLKGRNALGNKFIIPAQNFYQVTTVYNYNPAAYRSFDIVATRNNTVVNITPTVPVTGHNAGETFLIKLNRGETFSVRNVSDLGEVHLGGSLVSSNKPIAITLKEDSMFSEPCADLIGDQTIPIEVAGMEYIVMEGHLFENENLFITGIEDNTNISITGGNETTLTINLGETARYEMTDSFAYYIKSDKPIYVTHVTGFGCELGMAVIPSLNCKGSFEVPFTRSTSEFFAFTVLVREEGIENFSFNNGLIPIRGQDFNPVPGTNNEWYVGEFTFNSTDILRPSDRFLLKNSSNSFQLGLVNGDATSSCRYGYFSSFSTLFIGDDLSICEGEEVILDAGLEKENYLWSNGENTSSITVDEPGEYWVKTTREDCILSDTIKITQSVASLNLGPDREFCRGDTVKIDGKQNFSWEWSDGSTERFLETVSEGEYYVNIRNYTGCLASDTILLTAKNKPAVEIPNEFIKCREDTVILNVFTENATYRWNTGSTSSAISATRAREYEVQINLDECIVTENIEVINKPYPIIDTIYGSPYVCPFLENVDYSISPLGNTSYEWFVSGGEIKGVSDSGRTINWFDTNPKAKVSVLATGINGCRSDTLDFPVKVNALLDVPLPRGPDSLCLNLASGIEYEVGFTNGSIYNWEIEGGEIIEGQGENKILVDWKEGGLQTLSLSESSTTIDTVCTGFSPQLDVKIFKDSSEVDIKYVTVEDEQVEIYFDINSYENLKSPVVLQKRAEGDPNWLTISGLNESMNNNVYLDEFANTSTTAYEYRIKAENKCTQDLTTDIHNTLLLQLEKDSANNLITLEWNTYSNWIDEGYGINVFQNLDSAGLSLFQNLNSSDVDLTINAELGFIHQYSLAAISPSGYISKSNVVSTRFIHPIYFIPNVITPNNDGYNDFFEIPKIHLYPDAELEIINRWGNRVYRKVGYDNEWFGESLSTGVYYYSLYIPRYDQWLKGNITVLK